MTSLAIEEIDLRALADGLRARLGESLETGYLRGKTILRDALAAQLECSEQDAEDLVETLELNGFVRFPHFSDDTHPLGRRRWLIG